MRPVPSAADLKNFRSWLARRGRSETTQVQYVRTVKRLFDLSDPTAPLTDRKNSACYRNSLAVALRAWAKFSDDAELRKTIEEIKLPALVRQSVRVPLPKDEWFEVIRKLRKEPLRDSLKAVLEIIMVRGLRCSDALRISKGEVKRALKTGRLSFVSKGERRIEFSAQAMRGPLEVLAEMSGPDNTPVWKAISEHKMATAARTVRKALSRFAKKHDYEPGALYCHRFRHSYVNAFLEQMKGDPRAPFLLQDQMAWSSPATARNYVKHGEAAELDAIEKEMFSAGKKRA